MGCTLSNSYSLTNVYPYQLAVVLWHTGCFSSFHTYVLGSQALKLEYVTKLYRML